MPHNKMNRFIRFEYNGKALPPIDDYKSDRILSLDTALEPVLSSVNQIDRYIKKAKTSCHHPSEHDLTEDQSAAIYLYTNDWDDQSLNCVLNQALQSEDRAMVKPWLGFLELFNNALEKLPTVKYTIWRGLPNDIAQQLKENDEVVCWGVTSCSMSADIIHGILDQNSVLCSIKPLNGKNIDGYTRSNDDHEILLLPGTRLLVKSKKVNYKMSKPVIYLEEINDVSEEQMPSSDVTMISPHESANEEDTDNDHLAIKPTTLTNTINNKSGPQNEESKENKIKTVITFSNGNQYKVTYQNGRKQGYGKYYSVDGEKLENEDADDQANGEGICVFSNGDYFIGSFEKSNIHGHGIHFDKATGSTQAGVWANNELINQSFKIISSNSKYQWVDDSNKKRWYGAYYDDYGIKYIGNVVDHKAEGLGIRIWCDNSWYEGNFKDDKKHGYGIYHFSDRAKYEGQWANDEMNGTAKFKWDSGTKYKGQFTKGKRHGHGTLKFNNGKIQEGNWKNDEYMGVDTPLTSSNQ